MSRSILFLTTHNLVSNPRMVKEMDLAIAGGYRVQVICFEFRNWSFNANKELKDHYTSLGVSFDIIEAGKEHPLKWIYATSVGLLSKFLLRLGLTNKTLMSNAGSKRAVLLLKQVKKIKQADIAIGHNPGALYPTLWAAKHLKCKAGFDVEDYHPGEGSDKVQQQLVQNLMKQVLPRMDYVSFAAPLIQQRVESTIDLSATSSHTILNYFPARYFKQPQQTNGPVKLVWFSQNISAGRGLELILPVLKDMPAFFTLDLFGEINDNFNTEVLNKYPNIKLHGPLKESQLFMQLSYYDIGLAIETAADVNRDLCITNKLLAYLQAGLYVLASNTSGQQAFLEDKISHGRLIDINNQKDTRAVLESVYDTRQKIRAAKETRYQNFQSHNWETASEQLAHLWQSL